MNRLFIFCAALFFFTGCSASTTVRALPAGVPKGVSVNDSNWNALTDAGKAAKSIAVLRVRLLAEEGADKYGWDKVEVLHVIKNSSSFQFPKQLEIAHYSTKPGIPQGESTVYLEPYRETDATLWKLLEGSGASGVSHSQAPSQ